MKLKMAINLFIFLLSFSSLTSHSTRIYYQDLYKCIQHGIQLYQFLLCQIHLGIHLEEIFSVKCLHVSAVPVFNLTLRVVSLM